MAEHHTRKGPFAAGNDIATSESGEQGGGDFIMLLQHEKAMWNAVNLYRCEHSAGSEQVAVAIREQN